MRFRKRSNSWFTGTPALLLLLVLTGLLTWSAVRISLRYFGIASERNSAQEKIAQLQEEKLRLEASIRSLESPEGVERAAKETLNLKKEGEQVVVVVPPKDAATSSDEFSGGGFGSWFGALLGFFRR